MSYKKLSLEITPPIARLTLANGAQNVIDISMMQELVAAWQQVENDAAISVVVISGQGANFSSGVDVAAHRPESVRQMLTGFHAVIRTLIASKKVTVAVVRGNCLGGGAELAMVCDMVHTTLEAVWGFPEIKLGCFPPVAAVGLAALVGQKRAAELVLSGATISGRDATLIGLANACGSEEELKSESEKLIGTLAGLSPSSLAISKKALYAWDAMHFDKGLARAEQIYLDQLMKTHDAREGIEAWLEKRAPKWGDE